MQGKKTRRIRKYNRKSRKYRGGQKHITITKEDKNVNISQNNKEYFLKIGKPFDQFIYKNEVGLSFKFNGNQFDVNPEDELYFKEY